MRRRWMWILAIGASIGLFGGCALSFHAQDHDWPLVRGIASTVAGLSLLPMTFGWLRLAFDTSERRRDAKLGPVFPEAHVVHENARPARRSGE